MVSNFPDIWNTVAIAVFDSIRRNTVDVGDFDALKSRRLVPRLMTANRKIGNYSFGLHLASNSDETVRADLKYWH